MDEVIVIGSQALHGSIEGDLPVEAERSVEVDVAVPGDIDGHLADVLDGSIGEASMFHGTFGYYAQGVVRSTAVLPEGWEDRLVPFETPGTDGVVARCLEIHDLWISKAIAGRPKDVEFCTAIMERGWVDRKTLVERLDQVSKLDPRVEAVVRGMIDS